MSRIAIVFLCAAAVFVGPAAAAQAGTSTQLPFGPSNETWLVVDPVGQHVFVSGGRGTSSIVVLDFNGNIVKTITGEPGASQMAVDPATHTLYVALNDATAISMIDTETLTETSRFSTYPYLSPTYLTIAAGKLWFACGGQSGCLASTNLDGSDLTDSGLGYFPYGPVSLASGGSNDHLLATASADSEPPDISVYDVSSGSPSLIKSQLNPPSGGGSFAFVRQMAFDKPDGANLLIASGAPYFVAALSSTTFAPSFEYPTGPYPDAVAVSPDDKYVATGVDTGTGSGADVYLFPTGDTTPVKTWTIGTSEVPDHSVVFSPDGSELFALADNYTSGYIDFYVLGVSDTPDTEITSGPAASTYATAASFTFSSNDSAATFQCSLDGSNWQTCTSPASYSGLSTGSHTFNVRGVDGDSVDATPASRTWTISPPDTILTFGPDDPTTATTADFTFTSDDTAATFECSLDYAVWSACESPVTYTGLSPGTHTFKVRAVNDAGAPDPTGASETWAIHTDTPLFAELSASPNPVLTGDPVALDASGSGDSLGTIVDYQWDLGSGSFDQETGSTPTTTASFTAAGPQQVRVKVTDDLGDSAVASTTVDVALAPPPGQVGISIDNGDYATNSPDVELDVVWPAFAENTLISNDGGFGASGGTKTVPVATTIPWTLGSGGSERLPQIVYLRFPDSANPTVTFTDNIVLDTTTPTVQDATLSHHSAKQRSTFARGGLYKVRLRATEKISGIYQVRFSTRRSGGTTQTLRNRTTRGILNFSRTLTVRMTATPKWVRARSTAGNWSKWHRVR
jgi:hypothetical protein